MAMFIGRPVPVLPAGPMTGQTMSEKILARASHAESVHPGQIVDGDVDLLYMHEMLAMALMPFNEIGTMKVWDPEKIVVTLDHWVPPPTPEIAKMHQTIRDFCHKQGIRRFHDVGDHGIVHQLVAERGYAHPWDLVIGSDSHTNMVGAVGMIEADSITKKYLAHAGAPFQPIDSDEDASFAKTFAFDVDGMGPQVACPSNPANLKPVEDVEGTKIDVAFLGSCTNARIEDLRIAADLLRGEKVAPGVRFQITPASQIIYRQALKEGLVEVFLDAGATFTSSTCGPCFGGHLGVLAGDEVCISSTNRNYPGRMGSPQAQVYLASPWTVAASAIRGKITDPRKVWPCRPVSRDRVCGAPGPREAGRWDRARSGERGGPPSIGRDGAIHRAPAECARDPRGGRACSEASEGARTEIVVGSHLTVRRSEPRNLITSAGFRSGGKTG